MRVKRRTNIKLMLDTLNWLSIRQKNVFKTLQFIHKMCMGDAPEYLLRMIKRNNNFHRYNLRNNNDINLKKYKRQNTQNSLTYKGFALYNTLPESIKQERNENKYKVMIKKWVKNNIEI